MDEKYEKLHSYGKSLTQDLQAVQDHLYQALCQSEAEKAVEAKRFKEEISRLKQQLVAQRTDSERKIQRLTGLLEQEKRDAKTLTQEVDHQIAALKNNVESVAEYRDFLAEQQTKIEQQEKVLKDKKVKLDEREEAIKKDEKKLADDYDDLRKKSRKFEEADKSKKELREQIHQLEVDKKECKEKLEKQNQELNAKCRENDDLRTKKKHLEAEYKEILKKKDDEITKLNNELATYKHPGETENIDKIESNRIPIEGIDYLRQDDSDK